MPEENIHNRMIDAKIAKLKNEIVQLSHSRIVPREADYIIPMLISILMIWITRCLVKMRLISPQRLFALMIDNQYVKNELTKSFPSYLPVYHGTITTDYHLKAPLLSEKGKELLKPSSKKTI